MSPPILPEQSLIFVNAGAEEGVGRRYGHRLENQDRWVTIVPMMKRTTAQEATIFLHLPKTAGTTLQRICERQYPAQQTWSLHDQASVRRFKQLDEARRARIRFLKGHMPFGLHDYLPQGAVYFTLLRDPSERIISYYYYIRREPTHPLHEHVVNNDISLHAYVASQIMTLTDNGQTRLLAGVWDELPYGACTEATLAMAKENLQRHFAVVGLTEQFDATLLLLQRRFSWRYIYYARHNVTQRRPRAAALAPETRELLARDNELDAALYDYARERFAAQVAAQGADFGEAVATFRRRNRVIGRLHRLYWNARRISLRARLRR